MTVFNVFSLLGGLALFLFGMDIMGKALEKQAGGQLQKILSKLTDNPLKGFFQTRDSGHHCSLCDVLDREAASQDCAGYVRPLCNTAGQCICDRLSDLYNHRTYLCDD